MKKTILASAIILLSTSLTPLVYADISTPGVNPMVALIQEQKFVELVSLSPEQAKAAIFLVAEADTNDEGDDASAGNNEDDSSAGNNDDDGGTYDPSIDSPDADPEDQ